jgi:tetraprenyl-beta-curcumene synthase
VRWGENRQGLFKLLSRVHRQAVLVAAFATAAHRYWLGVFPSVRREIHRLRRRADDIPDPALRRLALDAHGEKWDSLEGAAAFAAFAPRGQRTAVARLLVDLQHIYDYADILMEQPSERPAENTRALHMAILGALLPGCPHRDYYAHYVSRDDGGYLVGLVDACRATVSQLPSYPLLADAIHEHVQRIVFYQTRIQLATKQDYPALVHWARRTVSSQPELTWWETGAAHGSPLAAFALLAAAADPAMTRRRADAIEAIYWPWGGALHTLLDSLVDRAEDAVTGQHELLDHYTSPEEMAERMQMITAEAVRRAASVGFEHSLILAGMTSLYLSNRRAWLPAIRPTTERVLAASGNLVAPAILILRARRLCSAAS